MQADIEAHYRWIEAVAAGASTPLDELARRSAIAPGGAQILAYESRRQPRTLTEQGRRDPDSQGLGPADLRRDHGGAVRLASSGSPSRSWTASSTGIDAARRLVGLALPDGPIKDLITDGIFAGVGAVVVFVPQIALLFLFLAILEDTGYLARAAFLMDRLLAKVGLHGKSFIPLLSSFACAIPGIMATRTIENRKDRLATIFVAPFMSCSAPPAGLHAADRHVLRRIQRRSPAAGSCSPATRSASSPPSAPRGSSSARSSKAPRQAFILELPTYKVPQLSQVARQVWTNTSKFLTKAGTTIFCLSVILWAMTYYPRLPEQPRQRRVATATRDCQHEWRRRLAQIAATSCRPIRERVGLDDEVRCSEKLDAAVATRPSPPPSNSATASPAASAT